MNQKFSLVLFCTGLVAFMISLGNFVSQHQTWVELTTPGAVGHIILLAASFISAIVGALGTQLPRYNGYKYSDRVSDKKIIEINTEGDEDGKV
jgi:hypothetical protein